MVAFGSAPASTGGSTDLANPSTAANIPPLRDVARPVSNLGNTCYMNAVLQALAHAPELCLAMDCNPHRMTCPVALENNRRRRSSSPTSSPEDSSSAALAVASGAAVAMDHDFRRKPARKLRRSSRKSPTNGMSANTTNTSITEGGSPVGDDGSPIYCALCEMEWHLQEVHYSYPGSNKEKAVAPSLFVNGFIDHVAPWFKLGQQEDSHEFLRLLIDAMQRSCKNARPKQSAEDDNMNEDIPMIGDEASSNSSDKNKNKISSNPKEDTEYPFELFRGTVESCVTCDSCKASSSTLDPIEDVGLEVTPSPLSSRATPPTNEALADVSSAFQRFARVENLDAGYKCEKCGRNGRATKQSRLASIPPILTLHLKRFRYGGDARGPSQATVTGASNRRTKSGSAKIEGHIKFDEIFDLKPYLTDKLQAQHKAMFCRLFAVVVHAGKNSHSGHYIAYVRNVQKNEWWRMDDGRVILVDPSEVMQAEAYMLFYRVVDHPFAVELKEKTKKRQEAAQLAALAAAKGGKAAAGAESEKENFPAPALNDKAAESPSAAVATPKVVAGNKTIKQEVATSKSSAGAAGSNSRKRALPEYTDGKSWAKAKTNLKPSQHHSLLSAAEYINENVQFETEWFKQINEDGIKDGAKVNHCPLKMVTGDDVARPERYRLGLKKVLHRMATRFGNENGTPFFVDPPKLVPDPPKTPSQSNLLDKFVAVGGGNAKGDGGVL